MRSLPPAVVSAMSLLLLGCGSTPAPSSSGATTPQTTSGATGAVVASAPTPPAPTGGSDQPEPPPPGMVGGDRDPHGCIGSAGYTWSELRQTCLRLFEDGVRLDRSPEPAGSEAALSAFLVFATKEQSLAKNDAVELFVPSESPPVILTRAKGATTFAKAGSAYTASFKGRWEIAKDGKTTFVASK